MSQNQSMTARLDASDARMDRIEASLATITDAVQALVTHQTSAKVTPVTPAPAVTRVVVTPTAEPTATGKVRRCKGMTKAGERCKVTSRSKFCVFHTEGEPVQRKAANAGPSAARVHAALATAKPTTRKGEQTPKAQGGSLTRAEWNGTVSTLARTAKPKGSGIYKRVSAHWLATNADEHGVSVQGAYADGWTPEQVIAHFRQA